METGTAITDPNGVNGDINNTLWKEELYSLISLGDLFGKIFLKKG